MREMGFLDSNTLILCEHVGSNDSLLPYEGESHSVEKERISLRVVRGKGNFLFNLRSSVNVEPIDITRNLRDIRVLHVSTKVVRVFRK